MTFSVIAILGLILFCLIVLPLGGQGRNQSFEHHHEERGRSRHRRQFHSGPWIFALIGGFVLLGGVLLMMLVTWSVSYEQSPRVTQMSQAVPRRTVSQLAPDQKNTPANEESLTEQISHDTTAETDVSSQVNADTTELAPSDDVPERSASDVPPRAKTPQQAFQSWLAAQVKLSVFGIVVLTLVVGVTVWVLQHRNKWVLITSGVVGLLLVMTTLLAYRSLEVRRAESEARSMVQAQGQTQQFLMHQESEAGAERLIVENENLEGRILPHAENENSDSAIAQSDEETSQSYADPVALAFRTDYLAIGSVVSLILLAFLIGAGVWIAHQRQHWTMQKFRQSASQFVWVLPMIAAVCWVGSIYIPFMSLAPLERDDHYDATKSKYYRFQSDSKKETEGQFQVATEGVSPWVANGKTSHSGKVLVPVHGGWRDSLSEARNQARQQAVRVLQNDFYDSFPQAGKWSFDLNLDELDAIPRLESESREFDIAGIQTEMYRTHMQVELSNNVRGEILQSWIPRLQTFRMWVLVVLMSVLMIVFFAIGGSLSLDMRTHGAYSRWIKFASLVIVLAAGIGAYMIRETLVFSLYLT